MTRFLIVSLLCTVLGCSSQYSTLVPAVGPATCAAAFKPPFKSDLYVTHVDVIGKKVSGLLLFKMQPDSTLRTVFMNEAGLTYFDFEYPKQGGFKVHQVIHMLNKKAVITTLQKDIALIGLLCVNRDAESDYTRGTEEYHAFPSGKETDYVVTDIGCNRLIRIEKGSRRKVLTDVFFFGPAAVPDSVAVRHHTFNMTISLKRLMRDSYAP